MLRQRWQRCAQRCAWRASGLQARPTQCTCHAQEYHPASRRSGPLPKPVRWWQSATTQRPVIDSVPSTCHAHLQHGRTCERSPHSARNVSVNDWVRMLHLAGVICASDELPPSISPFLWCGHHSIAQRRQRREPQAHYNGPAYLSTPNSCSTSSSSSFGLETQPHASCQQVHAKYPPHAARTGKSPFRRRPSTNGTQSTQTARGESSPHLVSCPGVDTAGNVHIDTHQHSRSVVSVHARQQVRQCKADGRRQHSHGGKSTHGSNIDDHPAPSHHRNGQRQSVAGAPTTSPRTGRVASPGWQR